MKSAFPALCSLALLASSCSFIPVDPGSEKVRLETPDRVKECKSTGSTNSVVLAEIAGIPRSDQAIESDLFKISANVAVKQGGNAMVPVGKHDKGRQKFEIYVCP